MFKVLISKSSNQSFNQAVWTELCHYLFAFSILIAYYYVINHFLIILCSDCEQVMTYKWIQTIWTLIMMSQQKWFQMKQTLSLVMPQCLVMCHTGVEVKAAGILLSCVKIWILCHSRKHQSIITATYTVGNSRVTVRKKPSIILTTRYLILIKSKRYSHNLFFFEDAHAHVQPPSWIVCPTLTLLASLVNLEYCPVLKLKGYCLCNWELSSWEFITSPIFILLFFKTILCRKSVYSYINLRDIQGTFGFWTYISLIKWLDRKDISQKPWNLPTARFNSNWVLFVGPLESSKKIC